MKIGSKKSAGGVGLLDLHGNLTLGSGDLALREAVRSLLDSDHSRIVLDLRAVQRIDSAGIGELIACKKRALEHGGDLRLLKPSNKVNEVLVLTRLSEVLAVFHDEDEALRWP